MNTPETKHNIGLTVVVDQIIDYENGELDLAEVLVLFSALRKSGLVFKLQGMYGRTFVSLVKSGLLTEQGDITGRLAELEGRE